MRNASVGVYTKLVTELELEGTNRKKAAIAKAKGVFRSIDYGFNEFDMVGPATKRTKVTVREIINDGVFTDVFGDVSHNLNALCLTQHQIVKFVKRYRRWLGRHRTFFLLKEGEEFFVVCACFDDNDRLDAVLYHISCDEMWYGTHAHHIVVPLVE